ncbi:MAG: F0F1 ATP synthase subunit epsilon, partial [Prochlorococcus sp.]|nr:F0F1 ATP synthase subunit epsilon [Prochlorococcus sp.]
ADDVTVLVNGAELGESIDSAAAEADLEKAKAEVSQMEGQETSPEKLLAKQKLNRARARVQASTTTS